MDDGLRYVAMAEFQHDGLNPKLWCTLVNVHKL